MARKGYIVAHGETVMDKQGRMHGRLDPPLTLKGELMARNAAKELKGKPVERIYSSPRLRAQQTAEILAKIVKAPIEIRPELVPWDLGRMSGAKVSTIKPIVEFFSSHPERVIPSGESKAAVLARYRKFVSELKRGKGVFVIAGHSQHTLGFDYAAKGGDISKVKMIGGTAGEVKPVTV